MIQFTSFSTGIIVIMIMILNNHRIWRANTAKLNVRTYSQTLPASLIQLYIQYYSSTGLIFVPAASGWHAQKNTCTFWCRIIRNKSIMPSTIAPSFHCLVHHSQPVTNSLCQSFFIQNLSSWFMISLVVYLSLLTVKPLNVYVISVYLIVAYVFINFICMFSLYVQLIST